MKHKDELSTESDFIFHFDHCNFVMLPLPLYSANHQQHHWSQSLLKLFKVLKFPALLCFVLALFVFLALLFFSVLPDNHCYRSSSLRRSFHLALCYVNGPPPTWGLQRHTEPKPSHIGEILKQSTRDRRHGGLTTTDSGGKKITEKTAQSWGDRLHTLC